MNKKTYSITRKMLDLPAIEEEEIYHYIDNLPPPRQLQSISQRLTMCQKAGYKLIAIIQPTTKKLNAGLKRTAYIFDGKVLRHSYLGYKLTLAFILQYTDKKTYQYVHGGFLYYTPKQLHDWLKPHTAEPATTPILSDRKDNGSKKD